MEKSVKVQRPEMPDEYVELEYDQQRLAASRGVLELAVRQLRAFARCATGSVNEADELVEDALMLFLAEDRVVDEAGACFAELLRMFRTAYERNDALLAGRVTPDDQLATLMQLTLPEREIAALCLGAGMTAEQAATLLEIPNEDAMCLLEGCRSKLRVQDIPEWPFTPAPNYHGDYLL
ncbi:hypothetical protein K1X12_05880 [Hyphomonas sp. WL0036]|uniref:hypothetical protein n=1 Tax=Hyphomonas sediminis TaxID=2866160 RepID=UPI001C81196D|nr:hypothetical protein [Hyphomonas sediminis]MBY9066417.1 hypothetical protein [Hyphomonas sediminis]